MNETIKVAIAHTQPKRKLQGTLTILYPWFIGIPIACYIYQGVEYFDMSEIVKSIIIIIVGCCCLAASGYIKNKHRR